MNGALHPNASTEVFCESDNLKGSYRYSQKIADEFWEIWLKAYIPSLIKRQKWHTPQRNIHVGDLMLILDQTDIPVRRIYPKVLVVEILPSKNGLVQIVKV